MKKTTVYLVYDEPIGEKMEQCQEQEEIVCSGDEDECFVREVSSNAQDYNVIVSSSGDEKWMCCQKCLSSSGSGSHGGFKN